jgi:hypothetical protein
MKKILLTLTLIITLFLANVFAKNSDNSSDNRNYEYYLLDKLTNADEKLLKNSQVIRMAEISNETVPNKASVCKAYVDALNKYPLEEDFIAAPMHPLSPDFDYPKWEQLDIFEHKYLYQRAYSLSESLYIRDLDTDYYNNNLKNKQFGFNMSDDIKERDREWLTKQHSQMYYARVDINNDKNKEDMIRIDVHVGASKMNFYRTALIAYEGKNEKSFIDIDKNLSDDLLVNISSPFFINNLFFYKGETYIKRIAYDYNNKIGFFYMYIKKFNARHELKDLCLISIRNK